MVVKDAVVGIIMAVVIPGVAWCRMGVGGVGDTVVMSVVVAVSDGICSSSMAATAAMGDITCCKFMPGILLFWFIKLLICPTPSAEPFCLRKRYNHLLIKIVF